MNLENFIIKQKLKRASKYILIILFLLLFLLYIDLGGISAGFRRIGNLFLRMFPADLTFLPSLYTPIIDTILVAFFSTFLGVLTAILLLPLSTNILFKHKFLPRFFSSILSVFRTIPSLIIAAILVSLFSVGLFSGFISLYLINFFMASKILKEYAEEVDFKFIETYQSAGFNKFQIYLVAILKNLQAAIYSVFFLVLESSIRGASVLGLVGAGGIGQVLWKELNHLRYDRVSIIIIILILIIIVIDSFSYYFRHLESGKDINKKGYQRRKLLAKYGIVFLFICSLYYASTFLTITGDRLTNGVKQMKVMFKGLVSPDFNYLNKVLIALGESLSIAFWSTLLAALSAILISYFTAKNISNKYSAVFMKFIVNILRTFPPVIVAIIFFRGFGPGFISSFFALYIYTLGIITKMYSEVLESIDNNILLSTKVLGLGSFIAYIKIIFKGYLPEFISISLYRFEMNIKNSTILGMVGAGGIGQLIINNIEFRNWPKISILLIVLTLTIIIIEYCSAFIREKIKL